MDPNRQLQRRRTLEGRHPDPIPPLANPSSCIGENLDEIENDLQVHIVQKLRVQAAQLRSVNQSRFGTPDSKFPEPLLIDAEDQYEALRNLTRDSEFSVPGPMDTTLIRHLGEGGFGLVFEARRDTSGDDGRFAIKFIDPAIADDRAIEREVEIATSLTHDHLARLLEHSRWQGIRALRYQFINGPTLGRRVTSLGPMTADDAAMVMKRVATAIVVMHRQGIQHHDLSPANVMLEGNEPKVIDFGFAGARERGRIGTDGFSSPESTRTHQSDVFSMGALLYFLVRGEPPAGPTTADSAGLDWNSATARTKELEAIASRALRKDPVDRLGSAEEFRAELERWLRFEPVVSRPASRLRRAGLFWWRNKLSTSLALAAVLSLIGLCLTLVVLRIQDRLAERRDARISAEVAMLAGRFDEAERQLDRAIGAVWWDNDGEAEMKRLDTLLPRMQLKRYASEIDRLERRAAPAHRVALAVHRADLELMTIVPWRRATATKVLRASVTDLDSLEPHIRLYALGLIADSPVEAEARFRESLATRPSYHRAGVALASLLTLRGKHQEAGERIRFLESVFGPDDPSVIRLGLLHSALQAEASGKREATLERLQRREGDEIARMWRKLADGFAERIRESSPARGSQTNGRLEITLVHYLGNTVVGAVNWASIITNPKVRFPLAGTTWMVDYFDRLWRSSHLLYPDRKQIDALERAYSLHEDGFLAYRIAELELKREFIMSGNPDKADQNVVRRAIVWLKKAERSSTLLGWVAEAARRRRLALEFSLSVRDEKDERKRVEALFRLIMEGLAVPEAGDRFAIARSIAAIVGKGGRDEEQFAAIATRFLCPDAWQPHDMMMKAALRRGDVVQGIQEWVEALRKGKPAPKR